MGSGVVLRTVGNGGNAQSMLDDRSGDGGRKGRGIGLVALLTILYGDLYPPPGDIGERLLGSL